MKLFKYNCNWCKTAFKCSIKNVDASSRCKVWNTRIQLLDQCLSINQIQTDIAMQQNPIFFSTLLTNQECGQVNMQAERLSWAKKKQPNRFSVFRYYHGHVVELHIKEEFDLKACCFRLRTSWTNRENIPARLRGWLASWDLDKIVLSTPIIKKNSGNAMKDVKSYRAVQEAGGVLLSQLE